VGPVNRVNVGMTMGVAWLFDWRCGEHSMCVGSAVEVVVVDLVPGRVCCGVMMLLMTDGPALMGMRTESRKEWAVR